MIALSRTAKFLEQLVLHSWWVILFSLLCYMAYEQGLKQRNADYALLHQRYRELQTQKEDALAWRHDLMMQINSQSDPAWVELTLMKGLGLVPEGNTKILFLRGELPNTKNQ